MDSGLRERVVLVTGASGGIGAELARTFLREGARVVAHFHTHEERLKRELENTPGKWLPCGGDLTVEDDVRRLFERAEAELGPVQVLIANAGYWPPVDTPVHQMSLEQWNRTLAVDLTSVFLCVREFFRGIVRHQLHDPAAVLIGSTAGMFGEANHADYAAAKAGLTYGFAKSLKNEIARIAPRGRVNVVCPGWTVTPMVDRFTAFPEKVRRVLQTISLRKVGRPADVAAAVAFLASPTLAGHISGEILTVSGGMEGRVLYTGEEVDPARA